MERIIIKSAILGGLIAFVLSVFVVLPNRNPGSLASTAQEITRKTEDEKKMPLAVYLASLPADSSERAMRLARNGRYDKRDTVPFEDISPTAKVRAVVSDWYAYMSALPVDQSDLIVLGEVRSANGYLSNDRTGAYSEFTVHIDDVFKHDGRQLDGSIIATREGADVQLQSGRVVRYEIVHQGMPRPGRQYVLFLKYNESGKDYAILTGYELRNGFVRPLDDVEPFTTYKNLEQSSFLQALRKATSPSEKGRLNQ